MTITIAQRPASIDGCMAEWSETFLSNIIRSQMEDMSIKVRRRTTGLIMNIDSKVNLKAEQYEDFLNWFRVDQRGGSIPTRIKRPIDGKEMVVRCSQFPTIQWIDSNVFAASMKWEQMPEWSTL
jgi:hypothetical protein